MKPAATIIETRAVYASARMNSKGDDLTHAVVIDNGEAVKVLCRVKLASTMEDTEACDVNSAPTCRVCAKRAASLSIVNAPDLRTEYGISFGTGARDE